LDQNQDYLPIIVQVSFGGGGSPAAGGDEIVISTSSFAPGTRQIIRQPPEGCTIQLQLVFILI